MIKSAPAQLILGMFLGMSLLLASEVKAQDPLIQTPLQDSKKAVEFFENELTFKTNPHGVNSTIKEKKANYTIVDVRSATDYAKGHVPGAINLPFDKYSSFEGSETEFPGLSKESINIVYCYNLLCNLGQKAAKKFASLGYPVKEMVGGFNEWEKDKYPIEK